jgi:hypothetical protein
MPSCREVARLISESLDKPLPIHKRVSMQIHFMMCGWCRAFNRQMHMLHKVIRSEGEAFDQDVSAGLSNDARQRIRDKVMKD